MSGKCHNPRCDNDADWSGDVNEAYCSWECSVEAREGHATL